MIFLLVHKQNKIIKHLYELQILTEEKNSLIEQKKELMLKLHTITQLSTIEQKAQKDVHLQYMHLNDIKPISTTSKDVHGAVPQ